MNMWKCEKRLDWILTIIYRHLNLASDGSTLQRARTRSTLKKKKKEVFFNYHWKLPTGKDPFMSMWRRTTSSLRLFTWIQCMPDPLTQRDLCEEERHWDWVNPDAINASMHIKTFHWGYSSQDLDSTGEPSAEKPQRSYPVKTDENK